MTEHADVLVVGASVAGSRCAQALRHNGFAGSVLLVGDESEPPYDRPPLSKQFLAGTWDGVRIRLLTDERAGELDVGLRLGVAATGLDPAARVVRLADGTSIGYGSVVVATGACARPSPWGTPPGVHTVRSLADSERLRVSLTPGARVVVIGGGWIGAEIAATAAGRGCEVLVVDIAGNPYSRAVGDELGTILCGIHARHGVQARFGTGVAGLRSCSDGVRVELDDGRVVAADAVVVGIGAVPNTGWVADSGLVVDDGVVCDAAGRAAGADGVWAAGDVARWGARRHEHWTNAIEQAVAVAHNIVTPHDPMPSAGDGYVWSDQYSWRIQLAGETGPQLSCEIIGDVHKPRLAAVYRDADGLLVGVATVNWPKAHLSGRRAIGTISAAEYAAIVAA